MKMDSTKQNLIIITWTEVHGLGSGLVVVDSEFSSGQFEPIKTCTQPWRIQFKPQSSLGSFSPSKTLSAAAPSVDLFSLNRVSLPGAALKQNPQKTASTFSSSETPLLLSAVF